MAGASPRVADAIARIKKMNANMTEGETEVRGNVPAFSFAGSDKQHPDETIDFIANRGEVQREIDLVHSNNNKDDNGKDEDQTNERTQEEISDEAKDSQLAVFLPS